MWAFPEPSFVSVCIFKIHFNAYPLALKNKISPFLFTIPVSYHLAIFNSCLISSLPSLSSQSILFTPHTTIIVQSHSFVHLLLNSSSTHRLCKTSLTLSSVLYFARTPLLICRPNAASVYIPHTDRTESHTVLFFPLLHVTRSISTNVTEQRCFQLQGLICHVTRKYVTE